MALRLKKSSTSYPLVFFMRDANGNPVTGLSPTVLIFKNGANGITPSGAVSEGDNGAYKVAGNATDTNTTGPLLLYATDSTGAAVPDERDFEVTDVGPELPSNYASLAIDSGGNVAVQSSVKKNVARAGFEFPMYDSADHVTPKTGLTVTAQRSIDGAAFANCSNSASEIGTTGRYKIDLSAADLNGNAIELKFTATGADPTDCTILTTP